MFDWNPTSYPQFWFVFVATILAAAAVFVRPRLTWPLMLVLLPVADCLKIGGYAVADEMLLLGMVSALLLTRINQLTRRYRAARSQPGLHQACFYSMLGYMTLQSFRGIFESGDLRLIRWVIYFIMLGLFVSLVSNPVVRRPSPRATATLLAIGVFISLGGYLTYGLVAEWNLEVNRWTLQDLGTWNGSAGVTFVVPLGLIAAFMCIGDSLDSRRFLGLSLLAVIAIVGFYFDSRTTLVSIFCFLLIVVTSMKVRTLTKAKTAILIAGLVISATLARFDSVSEGLQESYDSLRGVVLAPFRPAEYDGGRISEFYTALRVVSSDWKLLLVGGGTYSHKTLMPSYREDVLADLKPQRDMPVNPFGGSTGAAALLVDTGVVGISLFYANFFLMFRDLSRSKLWGRKVHKTYTLFVIVMMALWPMAVNVLDVSLLYLTIMPSGLLTLFKSRLRGGVRSRAIADVRVTSSRLPWRDKPPLGPRYRWASPR